MKAPSFQFYPDDFVGGVADMTQAEVGAYILLLCAQWGRGEIPTDPERAAHVAKGPVTPHVFAKFPKGKNPRMERVRAERAAYLQLQSNKGKASAQARFNHGSTAVPIRFQPKSNSPSPSPSPVSISKPIMPAKPAEKPAKAPKPPPERNELFDALATVCGCDPLQMTKPDLNACGVAIAHIRSVCPELTPAEINRRADHYRSHYRDAALTPLALCKHWAVCDKPNSHANQNHRPNPRGFAQAGSYAGIEKH